MGTNSVQYWIGVVASLSGLVIGLVTALWAYTKFVVERGLLPPVEFWTDCRALGTQAGQRLLEISVHLKNVGNTTLIATDIRVDILYLTREDKVELSVDESKAILFGRLRFTHSLRKDLLAQAKLRALPSPPRTKGAGHGSTDGAGPRRDAFYVMPYDTFVQSHIDQVYTFATAVPSSTSHVLIWSSFRYAQRPKPVQTAVLWVSRRLGLIQFTLAHATAPHTTERVFEIDGEAADGTGGTAARPGGGRTRVTGRDVGGVDR
jgi:hypothetical protein